MDVIGIDQSLSMSGLAKLENGTVTLERVKTETVDGLEATRNRIRYIVGRSMRFAPTAALAVIEAPYVPRGGKAAGAVTERAWLFGMLVDQLILRGPIAQVRTKTRAMYATDNGNAEKPEVLAAMRAKFPDLVIRDDNEADALALLCMGARYLGHPIDGVESKKQKQAMTSVVWPPIEGAQK